MERLRRRILYACYKGHTGATQRPHKGHTRAAGKNGGFCNISRFKIEVSISEIFKRDMLQKPYFLPVALVWPLCGPCDGSICRCASVAWIIKAV
jgi:hypothetical protein